MSNSHQPRVGLNRIMFAAFAALVVASGCGPQIKRIDSTSAERDQMVTVSGRRLSKPVRVVVAGGEIPVTTVQPAGGDEQSFAFRMPWNDTAGAPLPNGPITVTAQCGKATKVFTVELTGDGDDPPIPYIVPAGAPKSGDTALYVQAADIRPPVQLELAPIIPHGSAMAVGAGGNIAEEAQSVAVPLPADALPGSSYMVRLKNSDRYGGRWSARRAVVQGTFADSVGGPDGRLMEIAEEASSDRELGYPEYDRDYPDPVQSKYERHSTSVANLDRVAYERSGLEVEISVNFQINQQFAGNTWELQVHARTIDTDTYLGGTTIPIRCTYENGVWTGVTDDFELDDDVWDYDYGYRGIVYVFSLIWTGKDNKYYARAALTDQVWKEHPEHDTFYDLFDEACGLIENGRFQAAEASLQQLAERDVPMERQRLARMLALIEPAVRARDARLTRTEQLESAERQLSRVRELLTAGDRGQAHVAWIELVNDGERSFALDMDNVTWRDLAAEFESAPNESQE